MNSNPSSLVCKDCGTPFQPGSKFCIGCGAELLTKDVSVRPISPIQTVQTGNIATFDRPLSLLYFHWAFLENKNAVILGPEGAVIAEVSRTLVPLGIQYSLIDSITKETLTLIWVDETHIDVIQNNQKVGYIEIRKVKETIELKDLNDTIEINTEKEGFISKKTLYEGNDDDNTLGTLKPLNPEKITGNLPKNNLYELRISRFGLGMRKIMLFALFILIYFRSNPIR